MTLSRSHFKKMMYKAGGIRAERATETVMDDVMKTHMSHIVKGAYRLARNGKRKTIRSFDIVDAVKITSRKVVC